MSTVIFQWVSGTALHSAIGTVRFEGLSMVREMFSSRLNALPPGSITGTTRFKSMAGVVPLSSVVPTVSAMSDWSTSNRRKPLPDRMFTGLTNDLAAQFDATRIDAAGGVR